MRRINLLLILVCAFYLLGSAGPLYDYTFIVPPVDTVINYRWLEIRPGKEPEPVPPRRSVPEKYQAMFAAASESAGIPPGVLESIAYVESGFLATAKSPMREDGHRDLGMFQFNDCYLDWYSEHYNEGIMFDPFDPEEAIRIAALHIVFLYERYGTWMDVLFAYNAGIGAVDRNEIPDSSFRYLLKIYGE